VFIIKRMSITLKKKKNQTNIRQKSLGSTHKVQRWHATISNELRSSLYQQCSRTGTSNDEGKRENIRLFYE
jgi:hypothetical protein